MLMGVKELMFYCIEQEAQVRSKRRVEGTRVMKGGGRGSSLPCGSRFLPLI